VGYAQQVAADNASNAPYADGWQAGDDGGFGFGPWNFDGSYDPPADSIHLINSTHPENDVGTAWAISLSYDFGLARAGRGFDAPLEVGQVLSVVFDTPTDHRFYKGYTFRLNSGGGSICYGGLGCTPGTDPVERFAIWAFHDQDMPEEWGHWRVTPETSPYFIPVYDEDTDGGVRLDFKLTGPESYEMKITALDGSNFVYMRSGNLANAGMGAINWIEFLHYDELTDPVLASDVYIRSLEITGAAGPATGDFDNDGDKDGADFLAWQRGVGITSGATRAQGDSNGDGDVDAGDLATWKSQFGSAVGATSTIPEPGCSLLAQLGALGASRLGWRRAQRGRQATRREDR
jgi:hypothetical protein